MANRSPRRLNGRARGAQGLVTPPLMRVLGLLLLAAVLLATIHVWRSATATSAVPLRKQSYRTARASEPHVAAVDANRTAARPPAPAPEAAAESSASRAPPRASAPSAAVAVAPPPASPDPASTVAQPQPAAALRPVPRPAHCPTRCPRGGGNDVAPVPVVMAMRTLPRRVIGHTYLVVSWRTFMRQYSRHLASALLSVAAYNETAASAASAAAWAALPDAPPSASDPPDSPPDPAPPEEEPPKLKPLPL